MKRVLLNLSSISSTESVSQLKLPQLACDALLRLVKNHGIGGLSSLIAHKVSEVLQKKNNMTFVEYVPTLFKV